MGRNRPPKLLTPPGDARRYPAEDVIPGDEDSAFQIERLREIERRLEGQTLQIGVDEAVVERQAFVDDPVEQRGNARPSRRSVTAACTVVRAFEQPP
jgi:hypothetical protein